MRKLAVTFLFLLIASNAALAASAAEHAAAARAATERGEHQKAADLYEKAVALEPKNADYHYFLGVAYGELAQRAGMLKQASLAKKTRVELETAVALDPAHTSARFGLISFYLIAPGFMGGGEDKALAQAAEIRKRDALEGHRAYGRIYTTQKKMDLARKEYVDAVREHPNSARAHYMLGSFLINEKNWAVSMRELDAALKLDPAFMAAYLRLGQLAVRSESHYPRGEEALRKYLTHKPARDEPPLAAAWYYLGQIQEKQGKKAEARASYANALKLAPTDKEIIASLKRVS
jgi:tetratricopeptide (TPR) repeat protein